MTDPEYDNSEHTIGGDPGALAGLVVSFILIFFAACLVLS
jgi:hypothetical protein